MLTVWTRSRVLARWLVSNPYFGSGVEITIIHMRSPFYVYSWPIVR